LRGIVAPSIAAKEDISTSNIHRSFTLPHFSDLSNRSFLQENSERFFRLIA